MNKKTSLLIFGIIAILITFGLIVFGSPKSNPSNNPSAESTENSTSTENQTKNPENPAKTDQPSVSVSFPKTSEANKGQLVIAVTDAAVNLDDIQSLNLTVLQVKLHSPTLGWVSVSGVAKKFDLLKLNRLGQYGLLAEPLIPEGDYDQVSITVGDVGLTKFDTTSHAVKVPFTGISFGLPIKIKKESVSSLIIDFAADKSLHSAVSGNYVFFPTVKLSTEIGIITSNKPDGTVLMSSGSNYTFREFGLNKNGDAIENYFLKPNDQIEILAENIVKLIRYGLNESTVTTGASQAITITKTAKYLDKIISIELKDENKGFVWELTGTKNSARKTVYLDPQNGSLIER